MANFDQNEWANSGLDLLVDLPQGGSVRARLEEGLRGAIRAGRLPLGTRVPPSRALARDLGLSRGTVLEAYEQLAAEGWLVARQGSGTVVAVDALDPGVRPERREPRPQRWRFDLRPGRPDASSFPRAAWLRAMRTGLASASDEALGYGSAQGQLALRTELAAYLGRARGLRVSPADLLVTSGFTQGLGLVARALGASGLRRVAMEDPGLPLHRAVVRAAGQEVVTVDVDTEGARIDRIPSGTCAVVLTANQQHPTGVTLAAGRRAQLLQRARETGLVVIEDDYDGEFRYEGHPIGPLQGLAPESVVYAGTASKTLGPGVRLGWLALPERLHEAVVAEKECADWQTSGVEQLALAELLRSGAYDRHVRRMRLRYGRRRRTLIATLAERCPGLRVAGQAAGLNLVIPLPDRAAEAEALMLAHRAGVGIFGLLADGYHDAGEGTAGLVIGYAAAPEHAFGAAVDALVTALEPLAARVA
jgi:GntR family transcriptional regulator / MocR family aminotransferase